MNRLVVLLAGLLVASGASAASIISPLSQENAEKYFSIEEVRVTEIGEEKVTEQMLNTLLDECSDQRTRPFNTGNRMIKNVVLDRIINYGRKLWKVIEANKPVANINEMSANALPMGMNCWAGLSNWELPTSTKYEISYINGFGMEVITFDYRLFYTHGGQYEDKGAYLANVSITPMAVNVSWGFEFNADIAIENVVNVGPLADPVAGMELSVRWKVETPFKYTAKQVKYFVTGDGRDKEYK